MSELFELIRDIFVIWSHYHAASVGISGKDDVTSSLFIRVTFTGTNQCRNTLYRIYVKSFRSLTYNFFYFITCIVILH